MFSKSRQRIVCSNESYFPLSTVYPFLYLVFKHSLSRTSRFLRVNSSLAKNLNQYEKFDLRRSGFMCGNCKNMAYLITEISIIGWHTQIF